MGTLNETPTGNGEIGIGKAKYSNAFLPRTITALAEIHNHRSPFQQIQPLLTRLKSHGRAGLFTHRPICAAKHDKTIIMESIIFQDSPLAEYLEGEETPTMTRMLIFKVCNESDILTGEGGGQPDWTTTPTGKEPTSPTLSFAPRGRSLVNSKFRSRLRQPLTLKVPDRNAVADIHDSCSVSSVAPKSQRGDC